MYFINLFLSNAELSILFFITVLPKIILEVCNSENFPDVCFILKSVNFPIISFFEPAVLA